MRPILTYAILFIIQGSIIELENGGYYILDSTHIFIRYKPGRKIPSSIFLPMSHVFTKKIWFFS